MAYEGTIKFLGHHSKNLKIIYFSKMLHPGGGGGGGGGCSLYSDDRDDRHIS